MIVCPNCNHQNPDGATQCEACYTPLPQTMACPNCGTTVQADASFCGQCGFNLLQETSLPAENEANAATGEPLLPTVIDPDQASIPTSSEDPESAVGTTPPTPSIPLSKEASSPAPAPAPQATQLQVEKASLLHVQTQTQIELPQNFAVIHVGKPGGAVPPDIDVSGFPDSSIVSRIHADIRVEGGIYYLEDVGSANGTYVNHTPLPVGNRHKLRAGDRIALGKEDKVTFIFQMNS
jgi:pSer/pThr/pTyr-binding forkhead associated (FHA) protein/ribosomal protein L40E